MSPAANPYVLIVEDERKLATLLDEYLRANGFETAVVDDGRDVLPAVEKRPPDIVLLDLMLPGKAGLDVFKEVRAAHDIPIVMVTALVEEVDRLVGLELGADDYICKPFSPREVVARIRAVLRRAQPATNAVPAPIELDELRFEARVRGRALTLTPVEFRVLGCLAAQPGRVFSRQQLIDAAYRDHRVVSDRTVDSHIKNLRRKLADAGGGNDWIRSIYGIGYRMEP